MYVMTGSIIGSGLDWMTVTQTLDDKQLAGKHEAKEDTIWEIGLALAKDLGVEDLKVAKFGGYSGFSNNVEWGQIKGTLRMGQRNRKGKVDLILSASGSLSVALFRVYRDYGLIGDPTIKVTRLDEQVTIQADFEDTYFVSDYYDVAVASKAAGNSLTGRRKVTLYRSEKGDTVYIGSRSSKGDLYRIYDKSEDLGKVKGSVWRFEVERGRDTAKSAVEKILYRSNPTDRQFKLSAELTAKAGITFKGQYKHLVDYDDKDSKPVIGDKADDKTLAWIADCVRRPVRNLIKSGKGDLVLRALNLTIDDFVIKIDTVTCSGCGQVDLIPGEYVEYHPAENSYLILCNDCSTRLASEINNPYVAQ